MPYYSYKCEKCGEFEIFGTIRECLTKCPTCGGECYRIISKNVNAHYKSEGFYKYDTRFDKK